MSSEPADWLPLHSEHLRVAVDPNGAQLSVLRDGAGHDLLWDGNPAVWTGRAPILFPIVGALNGGRYRWQGRSYSLPRHGFARGRRFEVVSHDAASLVCRQRHDDSTRVVYPFEFELDVSFALVNAALTVTATARNVSGEVMPASLGFHPAFRWPLPGAASRDAHVLEFEMDEPSPIRRLDSAGLLLPDAQSTPARNSHLALHDDLFAADVIIFDRLASRRVRYRGPTSPAVEVAFPDATYLGLWSKPGAGFVCIEPWRGVADPVGFTGALDAKPGIHLVEPGSEMSLTMTIEVTA